MLRFAPLRAATLAVLLAALVAVGRLADACDQNTDRWVNGAVSYWHGALGRADFCNNATIGADWQKAADCAWNATVARFGAPPDSACARAAIEKSPQGRADLDEFVRKWGQQLGTDCSPATVSRFFAHWRGALGKAEYCNNASIGPDRHQAKNCAFQALVRDKGVSPSSCLLDAIANTTQGSAELDEFVRKWTVASGADCSQSSIDHFFNHWHGALGKAEYCNNALIGPNREKAKACAFQALVDDLGVSPTSCLRDAIANSTSGSADLDEFVRKWTLQSGGDCSQTGIDHFFKNWHGALGKAEYCNNATIGPDREKAKDCAFQALVRELGVSPTSCLRDAIANSAEGKADLDEFVRKWAAATGGDCTQPTIDAFFPHWHGALGREDYCNNASVGPDRQAAAECAFQALVRDKGVAENSCLKGRRDLDTFVRRWTDLQSRQPAGTVAANIRSLTPSDAESCEPSEMLARNFVPPRAALDWTPTLPPPFNIRGFNFNLAGDLVFDPPRNFTNALGANEGRLRRELRAAAKKADPKASLCESAKAFASGNDVLGRAFADLAVTGKRSFASFRRIRVEEATLGQCGASARAVAQTLDRVYAVANAIRVGDAAARARLGWIAVSGEDDQPHRPVNVPAAEFPQHDLEVSVPLRAYDGVPGGGPIVVNTRYMIAYPPPDNPPPTRPHRPRQLTPEPEPVLPGDAEVILYVHGMDSRLEEALDLTHALHRIARRTGKKYTVISMDLPTSGYADNIDHLRIASLETVGRARFRPAGADIEITDLQVFDAGRKHNVPTLDFIEDFIVSFVDTLAKRRPELTGRLRGIVGGSLGGNMAMRLGRRTDRPWITRVVPWSPAAIWPSFAEGGDPKDHVAVAVPWLWAGGDAREVPETEVMRRLFFYYGFDWRMGVVRRKSQAEEWFRDGWPCKAGAMFAGRLDRHETYDPAFRLWHWRLAAEQLVFSQQITAAATNQPLYLQNTKPMLLICGYEDTGGDLCAHTREVAWKMTTTPGRALFLHDTGHSVHSERPNWLARNIAEFLEGQ
jgi:pimeloyl-ACP methyl ester carboxylesterase